MEKKSVWKICRKHHKRSSKTVHNTDVLIVGGGMAGMSTAYFLNDSKKDITLIEKGEIGNGVSSCSTGKLTFLQGNLNKIKKAHNFNDVLLYIKAQQEAIRLASNLVLKENLKCNYQEVSSYLFAMNEKENKALEKERKILEEVGIETLNVKKDEMPIPSYNAFKVENTAVFHPVKFIKALAKKCNNVKIIEGTLAKKIKKTEGGYFVETENGLWKTKTLIIASHYPFFISPGFIPFKTSLERSYILASQIDNLKDQSGISIGKKTISYRYHKDQDKFLLFAGESHKMTHHIDYEKRYNALTDDFHKYFKTPVDYIWMTHDITTPDELPIIGQLDSNLYIITGFNKWGMTNGILSGKIISDLVIDGTSPYQKLFSPTRYTTLPMGITLLTNSLEVGSLYLRTTLVKNHNFYHRAYVVYEKGVPYGVYIDDKGIQHKVLNKCPHFKCNLIFNNVDVTWDCPCHGSRFDIDGNIIEGPSTNNIKTNQK